MDYIPENVSFEDLMSRWYSKDERNRYLFFFNYIATCVIDKILDDNNEFQKEVTLPSNWLLVMLRIINVQNKKRILKLLRDYSKDETAD